MNFDHQLQGQLKTLRLGGFMETLDVRLQQAQSSSLGYLDFLHLLVQDEIERRESRKLSLRLSRASFEEEKPSRGLTSPSTPKSTTSSSGIFALALLSKRESMSCSMAPQAQARVISPKPSAPGLPQGLSRPLHKSSETVSLPPGWKG